MTMTSNSVISGVAFPVESVDGRDATLLAQFLDATSFTISMAGTPYRVFGCGSPLESRVRFHEKDEVLGHDVRVLHVQQTAGGFEAEHVAAF